MSSERTVIDLSSESQQRAGVAPPNDWDVCRLGAIAALERGKFTARPRNQPRFFGGSMPFIQTGDIANSTGEVSDYSQTLNAEGLRVSKVFPAGTLFFTIAANIGDVGIVTFETAATDSLIAITPRERVDKKWLYHSLRYRKKEFEGLATQNAQLNINLEKLRPYCLTLPTEPEQRAIAGALSDVDELIGALEKLIAKKRAIKQAAMQQLLTGRSRLPGFSDEWERKRVGDFTDCTAGGTPSTLVADYWGGSIRWMNSGELNLKMVREVEGRITDRGLRESSTTLIPPRCVLIGLAGQGKTRGTVAMNLVELCTNQSIAAIFPNDSFIPEYLYYSLDARYDELRAMSTGDGGRGGLNLRIIRSIELPFPSREEQAAIAAVLSDVDAEIAALEHRRDKTKQIKQGMMQQLLTGRVRLVKPEVSAAQAGAGAKNAKAHSWAFNEAVVISMLAKHFGTEQFPLGRKRYTKLSYLLHRHMEKQAEGYLKKAAGPYNPKTRYGGPERIAVENGHVREHKCGPYSGFVASDNIAQAESYFEKWYGPECIQWLEQFRRRKNDELELLATVDMAAEELRAAGKDVDVDGVKGVIGNHPEWQAKLDRAVFSDSSIARAIETCHTLFQLPEDDSHG